MHRETWIAQQHGRKAVLPNPLILKMANQNQKKTHCRHGHEYTPENTRYYTKSGSRTCLACARLRDGFGKGKRNHTAMGRAAWLKRQRGREAMLYVIQLHGGSIDEEQPFFKVGVTFCLKSRYIHLRMEGYRYCTLLATYASSNAAQIWDLEQLVIESNSKAQYTPLELKGGKTECFSAVEGIIAALPVGTVFLQETTDLRLPRIKPLAARFWEKVDKTPGLGPQGECWEWTASLCAGYGQIGLGAAAAGRDFAHRVSYRLHKGEIPDGLRILHSCDNPKCVNPAHLRAGTVAANSADMMQRGRGRSQWVALSHCKHGHELTPENSYKNGTGRTCKTCSFARTAAKRARLKAERTS